MEALVVGLGVLVFATICGVALLFLAVKREAKRKAEGRPPGKYLFPAVVETKYLGAVTKDRYGNAGGALWGGLLFGPIGAILGSMQHKGTQVWHQFAVKYDNGTVKIVECLGGSQEHEMLLSFAKWDEPSDYEEPSYTYDELPAIENGSVDWNEQAVRAAKEWLEIQPFSRKALIEQLEEDGFTHEQAEYAADAIER